MTKPEWPNQQRGILLMKKHCSALLSSATLKALKRPDMTAKGNDCRIVSIVKKKKTFVTSKSRTVLLR